MSRLDDLLTSLCPDGVEYKPLWSLTAWDKRFNGLDKGMQSKIIPYKYLLSAEFDAIERKEGDVFYLSTGISGKNRYTTKELAGEYLASGEIVCIPWGGMPNIKYFNGSFVTGDNRIATSLDVSKLNNKFLYYFLESRLDLIKSYYRGSGLKHPSMKAVLEISIPVPPIEIQHEIVRILDTFTALTANLQAELQAELQARKTQYEYYKNTLLEFGNTTTIYNLSEICEVVDCPHSSPTWKEAGIPVIRNFNLVNGIINTQKLSYVSEEDYLQRTKRIVPQADDIMFSREAPIGNVGIVPANFKCCQGQRVVLLRPNKQLVYPRFLLNFLQSKRVKSQFMKIEGTAATVSNFGIGSLKQLKIYLPSMEEQKRIADTLDSFSVYCSEYSNDLSCEIETRKKQYGYYRDELLTFKELRNE